MSWQMVALIGIIVVVVLSIPTLVIGWMVARRGFKLFDGISADIESMDAEFKRDPFADLNAEVRKLTGPRSWKPGQPL